VAHIAKYKASAVGKLCAHYNRWQGIDNPNVSRENIDKSRTHLNYTLGVYEKDGKRFIGKVRGSASWATVKGRIDAVNERYSRLAKETGRSRSFYVNEALQEAIDRFEYEYGILKDIEDYRAGRLETYSIDEVRAHCGLAN
jgi:RHH-type rel operon transcriptional repressor/antitoxin RelB